MIVGCYSMNLYCDGCNSPGIQNEFTGRTASECRKEARRIGWRFDLQANEAYCKKCMKRD